MLEGGAGPGNPAEAGRVQRRLADLGFLAGRVDGAWGPVSRAALRDFKVVNGLPPNDRWDARTAAVLEDNQALSGKASFIGTWAADAAGCRAPGNPAIRITIHGADSSDASCSFGPIERDGSGWRIKATCAGDGTDVESDREARRLRRPAALVERAWHLGLCKVSWDVGLRTERQFLT